MHFDEFYDSDNLDDSDDLDNSDSPQYIMYKKKSSHPSTNYNILF